MSDTVSFCPTGSQENVLEAAERLDYKASSNVTLSDLSFAICK